MLVDFKTKDTKKALPLALLLVAIALFFVSWIKFDFPDPPIDQREVSLSLADFGNLVEGDGNTESENPSETLKDDDQAESQTEAVEEPVEEAAQDIETQQTSTVVQQTSSADNDNTSKEEPKQNISSPLDNILGQINSNGGGGSDGDNDGQSGNNGNPDGNIDGKGVLGDGTGEWDLSGRGITGKPIFSEKPKDEGTVVVDIYVNQNGKVVSANVNVVKSNTGNSELYKLAVDAAKKATFTVNKDAPPKQKGSITFHFKLK